MKNNVILMIGILFIFSACTNKDEAKSALALKQKNCLELTNVIQQNLANNPSASQILDEVFYSPKLDTCVFGYQVKESFYLISYPDQKTIGTFNDEKSVKKFKHAKEDLQKK